MEKDLDRQEIEKQVLRDVLIKSFRFPRFDTLQEYLRQRAGVSDDELQEIRYQIGAMGSSERIQYESWKEHIAERKKNLFKDALPKLLISDVNEKDIRLWIEMGELSEEDVNEAQDEAEKLKNANEENIVE
ncbi:hypothetical protein ON064_03075 [Planococcus sp. A6]|uniref:hypothetical protein n=1 Tax=Planococcus sp. A6 TaxID=2992760 RepID=UPI00237BF895|nr:hypothetical protein [Planococcus sp. A6]MDE0582027.1 hypothetical protein [Planococcus sp. A6]